MMEIKRRDGRGSNTYQDSQFTSIHRGEGLQFRISMTIVALLWYSHDMLRYRHESNVYQVDSSFCNGVVVEIIQIMRVYQCPETVRLPTNHVLRRYACPSLQHYSIFKVLHLREQA
jgi:hypothetical protein